MLEPLLVGDVTREFVTRRWSVRVVASAAKWSARSCCCIDLGSCSSRIIARVGALDDEVAAEQRRDDRRATASDQDGFSQIVVR